VQASKSIASYGVHAVVANILERRKEVVQLVQPASSSRTEEEPSNGGAPRVHVDEILRGSKPFIEGPLVQRVVQLHRSYQQGAQR
jgi:hypothetical protein